MNDKHITLLYGTGNAGKMNHMRGMLEGLPIHIIGLSDITAELPAIDESGNDPLENARIKAKAYYKATGMPVFSCDSGLYIEGVSDDEQPGVHVRNIGGRHLSDDEMTAHYSSLAAQHGGRLRARYKNAICLVLSEDEIYEHMGDDISGGAFYIVDKPHSKTRLAGFPLDALSVHIESGKYYYDMERKTDRSDMSKGFRRFFKNALSLENNNMHNNINKLENVKTQYADDKNLSVRSRLHTLYSTNKQGLVPWLFERYDFAEGCRILELGCGNASQWDDRVEKLPNDASLVLSDFSNGMVDIVKNKYGSLRNLSVEQIDIQAIPFSDESFDIVIANFMLYHVPDIHKGLSEVKRILKPTGTFYTATNGNGGMRSFLRKAFLAVDSSSTAFAQEFAFSIQNGTDMLKHHFAKIQYHDYTDSLAITSTDALMEWIKSTISIATYSDKHISKLFEYFEAIRLRDGFITIPKECGLFICKK